MTDKKIEEKFQIAAGNGMPLGVSVSEGGRVQFSIMVPNATWCQLQLRKKRSDRIDTISMDASLCTGSVFSVSLYLEEPYEYCYRYRTAYGTLRDPYARSVSGREEWGIRSKKGEWAQLIPVPSSMAGGYHPILSMNEMILYRLHVRGFTKHSSSRVKGKGTFLGVMEKIPYMKELGINAVELMPCYDFDERTFMGQPGSELLKYQKTSVVYPKDHFRPKGSLEKEAFQTEEKQESFADDQEKQRINYWGYTDQAYYFAPKASYAYDKKNANLEFMQMVQALHEAGIEVIMEMFFSKDMYAGMIVDCLRYWHMCYKIDGFRITNDAADIVLAMGDPYLTDAKLFRVGFSEEAAEKNAERFGQKRLADYNDYFMTVARKLLKGDEGMVPAFVDCFLKNRRSVENVNYIANTNGFTLMDLVSYDQKHNFENGENGADGTEYNHSWNCGVEGPCRKKGINRLRKQQIKNAYLMVMLSQGIPLLLAGDEWGNSQQGNNNAYCQDNEVSWLNWKMTALGKELSEFLKQVIQLRKDSPHFHAIAPFKKSDYLYCGYPDLSIHGTKAWYPDYSNYSRAFAVMIAGRYFERKTNDPPLQLPRALSDESGEPPVKKLGNFYVIFNLFWQDQLFDLPALKEEHYWRVELCSCVDKIPEQYRKEKRFYVPARSIVVLRESEEAAPAEPARKKESTEADSGRK